MRPADLAREVNMTPPTIHRLITGKSMRPYKSSLKPIADYFSMSVAQLVGETPFINTDSSIKNKIVEPTIAIGIPLISWNSLSSSNQSISDKHNGTIIVSNTSEQSFATILEDSSMEPIFYRGSVLIFDAHRPPKDRSFVLVQLNKKKLFVFRQVLVDLDRKYLKSLNPDLISFPMRLLNDGDKIIATLVEARQLYIE
jgi:hypothetical protein